MSDRFVDNVAELAGVTYRELRAIAAELEECGLTAQAVRLHNLAVEHFSVVTDCYERTQPMDGTHPTDK